MMLLAGTSISAAAEWVRIGENNRSVAYADSKIQNTGDYVTLWVMFDYEKLQGLASRQDYQVGIGIAKCYPPHGVRPLASPDDLSDPPGVSLLVN